MDKHTGGFFLRLLLLMCLCACMFRWSVYLSLVLIVKLSPFVQCYGVLHRPTSVFFSFGLILMSSLRAIVHCCDIGFNLSFVYCCKIVVTDCRDI